MNATADFRSHQKPPTPDSILVIDSGVGGLSVCQSILAQQPQLRIIYFADSAYFPYGLLPEEQLSERLQQIVSGMLALHQPKLVVLACNTVSTLVLPELRARYDIPFVGVVPAIKPAASLSISKRIGLLATPATVNRPYTDQLIQDHAQGCAVIKVGSSELVHEAEKLLKGQPVLTDVIGRVLKPFKDEQGIALVDTVVLGCTHFPLLKTVLSQELPNLTWVDSGAAIANRVSYLLAAMPEVALTDVAFAESTCASTSGPVTVEHMHQVYFSSPITDQQHALGDTLKQMGMSPFELHSCLC